MRDIEVEEGEGYLFRDGDDDDENIDPDRDLSYIDRKLEKLLGHYQKDFMRGFSADSQGTIFGGYGSFLPVYERSPPILSNHRSQSQVCSKSPSNLQSKHFSQTPSVPANTSLPARTAPVSSNQSVQFLSKSGVPTMKNQLTVENSAKCASNHHVEPKIPPLNHSGPKLKFRVKMAPESVLPRDNSSIYNGLGLDMSPSSSPAGTPLEKDGTLLGLQETNLESPSFIVKIMTSTAVPNEALISPLHDDLISLMEVENTSETHLPRSGQVEPLDIVHDSFYLDGRKASVEKEQKLKDTSKENNSKQKDANKETKSKQDTKRQKPSELVKEDNKEDGNVIKIRRKSEKDKNLIPSPKDKPGTKKRNEFGLGEEVANKVLKQHSVGKNEVKEEDLDSVYPKKAYGYRKESGIIANNKEVAVVYEKDVKDNNTHYGIPQEIKHEVVSSNQKSYAKAIPPLQKDLILEEPPSVAKKDFRTGSLSSTQPPRGSAVSSSRAEYEEVIPENNPSRSKRGDVVLPKEIKDNKVAVIENTSKKKKEVSLRGVALGATEREGQQSASKMKVQLNSRKVGVAAIPGPNSGDVMNVNFFREKVLGDELPPPENASLVPLEMDDWVQCEKCQKWRLLPFGTNPDSLPKEWICSMLTWLPGMSKCSVSEDETTHALRARYLPTALGPSALVLNDQQAHLGGTACVKAFSGAQNVGLSNLSPSADVMLSRGKKHSLSKLEIHAARQSGGEDFSRAMKRDLQHSGGTGSLKNLKKNPLETACSSKYAAGRPSKIPKKRMAETEVYGVSRKIKKVHQQSLVNSGDAGLIQAEIRGQSQNYNPDAFQSSRDFVRGSSECPPLKLKNRGLSAMQAMNDEVNVVSEKKRKLKDQCRKANASEPFCNGQRPQDINTKGNNGDKGHRRMKDDVVSKHNLGCADDISTSQELGIGPHNVEPYHSDRMSRKIADARKSEKAGNLGLSDNATTSSSSKISMKVKVKAREVKCSPVGSISSSPLKVYKSDPEKGMDKVGVLYDEPVELSSRKRLKSKGESPCASNEFAPRNEVVKDRKSNLSKIAGVKPDAVHEDQYSKKVSSRKPSNANRVGALPKLEDFEAHNGKLDHRHHEEGTVALQKNSESQRPNGLNFDGTSLDRQKLHTADMSDEKGSSSYSLCVPELEKGGGFNSVRVDNDNGKLSRHVLDNRVNLRHPHNNTHAFKAKEDSTSMNKDSFHWAVTALQEAKALKHTANCLKTTGSGFSTGLFFQAALKFLHGASLLEPGDSENGRLKEMSSTEVYSSTAKLFEYCAHEFEKCDDMASAALAYKCMEVAYMRVVYNNDVAATRELIELQMAVRAAPHVESPSSSASDIDNLNNHMAIDLARIGHSAVDDWTHVISAGSRPNFVRLISFTHDINLAMEASRKSQNAFAVANSRLSQAGNEEGISSIKRVLDFSFHDVDGLLCLVRLAMAALEN
ncbi:cysteine-tryptophan domain-containing zinc finger protein 3-like isoform X2 [Silene latifolia]|uniref:cysteine-tryptophan domain-containing zinc finger protein 3-like isoform X2 n=1 Tax=Silene latifolia TaxID=37657 RepID=UPI003D77DDF3